MNSKETILISLITLLFICSMIANVYLSSNDDIKLINNTNIEIIKVPEIKVIACIQQGNNYTYKEIKENVLE